MSRKNGSMGWRPGSAIGDQISKTCPLFDVISRKPQIQSEKNLFSISTRRRAESFANSLCSILKLRSTLHDIPWHFHNLAYSSGLICLAGLFLQWLLRYYSVRISYQTEHNYLEIFQACFLNHTFTFCAIGLLDNSCIWKRKKLQYNISAISSSYYINSEYFRSCKNVEKLTL